MTIERNEPMNNEYEIKVSSPLVRSGVEIKTRCSEKYLVPVLRKLFNLVREFNGEVVK